MRRTYESRGLWAGFGTAISALRRTCTYYGPRDNVGKLERPVQPGLQSKYPRGTTTFRLTPSSSLHLPLKVRNVTPALVWQSPRAINKPNQILTITTLNPTTPIFLRQFAFTCLCILIRANCADPRAIPLQPPVSTCRFLSIIWAITHNHPVFDSSSNLPYKNTKARQAHH